MSFQPDLSTETLLWTETGVPVSERFGDVYYSAQGGLAETRHVFLAGCGMPDSWAHRRHFTIGETGFGTGLNLLSVWHLWQKTAPKDARLTFVSTERYPLQASQAAHALAAFPELAPLAQQLLDAWPPARPGWHQARLDRGRIRLLLLVGDAAESLAEMEGRFDAWFLDGFAPAVNPQMWSEALFAQLARLSAPGAMLASFTVAGLVRRGLQTVGFAVDKRPGFGRKREVLTARFVGPFNGENNRAPWLQPPPATPEGPVLVVGGGLAGCSVAGALAARGRAVTLVEQRGGLARAASALPQGLVMPRPSAEADPTARYLSACFDYAVSLLPRFGHGWQPTGALWLETNIETQQRLQGWQESGLLPPEWLVPLNTAEASTQAGIALPMGALWLPQAGLADPAALCHAAIASVHHICLNTAATGLARAEIGWRLQTEKGDFDAAAIVLASANDLAAFPQARGLALKPMRGQTSRLSASSASAGLRLPLTYGGYITPARDGLHEVGATFDPVLDLQAPQLRPQDHTRNLAGLARILPGLVNGPVMGGHVGLRAVTPDRLPLAGILPDLPAWAGLYARLSVGERLNRLPAPTWHEGLAVHLGLGARGLTTAWLTAELIAAQLCGEPWPMPRSAAEMVLAGRFLLRDLRRGRV